MFRHIRLVSTIVLGIIFLIIWFSLIVPQLTNTPEIFESSAENFGTIQLSDDVGSPLSDPIKMVFLWNSHIVERNENNLLIHTVYDYRDILTNEILWISEFDESVDLLTRQYTQKSGHFIFPQNLEQKSYQVYDVGGSVMFYHFMGITEIDGLEVYEFSGTTTFDVSDVYPDFEEPIFEDYTATNFIEPVTGIDVFFNEQFTDYALIDGKKIPVLEAWDESSEFSKKVNIQKATSLKSLYKIYYELIPIVIVIITASITLMILFQQQLSKKQEDLFKLEKTDKLKDEFVSMLGHEIRNPLTPILGACALLLSENDGNLNEKQRKRIEMIIKNSNRINELLKDFSEVKKLDLDLLSLSKSKVDLKEYMENVLINNRPYVGDKNIHLDLNLNDSWIIYCDTKRISQVFSNLIKNSIDFVSEKSGKITISAKKDDKGTIFTVEDNGIGISPEYSETIFEKFMQLNSLELKKREGTGLGLSICKGIIEAHGGRIWLDTDYTSGARFMFFIPN